MQAQQQRNNLDRFLAGVERRAFRLAQLATGQTQPALDIVQDAMLTLSKKYAHKLPSEWGPLFHRILQNKIKDWYRRQSLSQRIFDWFGMKTSVQGEIDDVIQTAVDRQTPLPFERLKNADLRQALNRSIEKLPRRQQQAFLLRHWEGFSVKQTASVMQCSEGSVKTHVSRATQFLKQQLEGFYHDQ